MTRLSLADGATGVLALLLPSLFALALAGCEMNHACGLVYAPDGATLTLHLPPVADVAPPETVTACRQPDCLTATLPAVETPERVGSVDFSSTDVSGLLNLGAGGVRVLTIRWIVHDASAVRNQNEFDVQVKDANGQITASLADSVTYTPSMPNGEGCGVQWYGTASD
jgi:hypothetical protein